MSFTRLSHADEAEWLEQRREYVTATDVHALLTSTSAARRVASEKEHGSTFHGNAVTRWGHEREPVIGEFLSVFGPDTRLKPNDDLLVKDGTRYAATPDMISDDGEVIGEIKTTGTDWPAVLDEIPLRYRRQVQWQLLVTGAEACVFAWEVRGTGPLGEFYPAVDEPRTLIIRPDREMQRELRDAADRFLAGDFEVPVAPEELQGLVDEYLDAKQRMADAKAAVEEIVGTDPETYEVDGAKVIVTADGKSTRLDAKALEKDHPNIAAHYYVAATRKGSVKIQPVKPKKEAA